MLGTTLANVLHLLNTSTDVSAVERATILGAITNVGLLLPTGGTSAAGAPVDLQSLVNAIPIAEEGHIITSQYHNSLRAALLAIVARLGSDPLSGTVTLTFAPTFLPNGSEPSWLVTEGMATIPGEATRATGWFPLQLPEGARLQNMMVIGRRAGAVHPFQVALLRQPINATATIELISIDLKNAGDPFQIPDSVNVAGAGIAALEEYRLINNSAFKYLVRAIVNGGNAVPEAQIFAIRVAYRR